MTSFNQPETEVKFQLPVSIRIPAEIRYVYLQMWFGNDVVADQSRPRGIPSCTTRQDRPTIILSRVNAGFIIYFIIVKVCCSQAFIFLKSAADCCRTGKEKNGRINTHLA